MPLLRKSSEDQLSKVRDIVRKSGGDIGDKTTKSENGLPNIFWIKNPSDSKIDTHNDKIKPTKMKHLKTYEDFKFSNGSEEIPDLYLKQWLALYLEYCDINEIKPKYENLTDIIGDDTAISEIYKIAKKLKTERQQILDGSEFMDDFFLKESKMYDFLRAGKGVDVDGICGVINKLDGNFVYIETVGGEIEKIKLLDFIKKYKKK